MAEEIFIPVETMLKVSYEVRHTKLASNHNKGPLQVYLLLSCTRCSHVFLTVLYL